MQLTAQESDIRPRNRQHRTKPVKIGEQRMACNLFTVMDFGSWRVPPSAWQASCKSLGHANTKRSSKPRVDRGSPNVQLICKRGLADTGTSEHEIGDSCAAHQD
jgi:hypothetical protein